MGSGISSSKPQDERQRQKNKFYAGQLKTQAEDDNDSNDKVNHEDSSDNTTTVYELEPCSSSRSSSVSRISKADNANTKKHKTEAQSHKTNTKAQNKTNMDGEGSTKSSDETTNEVQDETGIKNNTNSENVGKLSDMTKTENPQVETSGKSKANKDTRQKLETGQSESQGQKSNCLSDLVQDVKSVSAAGKGINTEEIMSRTDSKQLDVTLTDDVFDSRDVEERVSTMSKIREVPKGKSEKEITDVQTSWSHTTPENQDHLDDMIFDETMKNRTSAADSKKTVKSNDDNPKANFRKQDGVSKPTVKETSAHSPRSTRDWSIDSILNQKNTENYSKLNLKEPTGTSKLTEEDFPGDSKLTAKTQLEHKTVTDRLEQEEKHEEEKLTANYEFYRNEIKSRPPPGHTIEEMLGWQGNFKELEKNHSYIQWLFPMFDNSGMNPDAQALQIHEAEAITEDPELKDRVLRAFKMMLHFYGMQMVFETNKPVKFSRANTIWRERYEHLNRSTHNHLRITRILRSIGYLGYQCLQFPWFEFILQESYAKDTLLPRLQGGCIKYWVESLEQQDDQLKAVELWTKLNSDTKQPSRKHSDKRQLDQK